MNSFEDSPTRPSTVPRNVLIVMPRWVRDGGVGAHMMRSAAAAG